MDLGQCASCAAALEPALACRPVPLRGGRRHVPPDAGKPPTICGRAEKLAGETGVEAAACKAGRHLPQVRSSAMNWRRFGPAGLMIVAAVAMTLTPVQAGLDGPADRGLRRRRDRLEHRRPGRGAAGPDSPLRTAAGAGREPGRGIPPLPRSGRRRSPKAPTCSSFCRQGRAMRRAGRFPAKSKARYGGMSLPAAE